MSRRGRTNNSRYRKEIRYKAAKERSDYRATLTPLQQLKRLDERLGANKGASKERKRLNSN